MSNVKIKATIIDEFGDVKDLKSLEFQLPSFKFSDLDYGELNDAQILAGRAFVEYLKEKLIK